LETYLKSLSKDENLSTPDQGTQDGQPSVCALSENKDLMADVMVTVKGNRLFIVHYIRQNPYDLNGGLFIRSFRMP
jgi:uncharacterized protein YdeI (BOF family)